MLRRQFGNLTKLLPSINNDRAVMAFTGALALVAIFLAWMMYTGGKDTHALAVASKQQANAALSLAQQATKQVLAMKTQNVELKKSLLATQALVRTEKSQAESTAKLAAASHQSASAAVGALVLAQQSDRAWLFIHLNAPQPHAGSPDKVTGTITNVGHTVAHVDQVNVAIGDPSITAWEISQASGHPPIRKRPTSSTVKAFLFPGNPNRCP